MDSQLRTEEKPKLVVALLPCYQSKLLMQLRDQKEGIIFPGHWGLFSGAVEKGETPLAAARRELFEELGCKPRRLKKLGIKTVPGHHTLSHVYYFSLEVPPEQLPLFEGTDFGLFSLEEILSLRLHSSKLQQWFPVIDSSMLKETVRELFTKLKG